MDPTGGNSNIGTDHDVSLNLLANDYPAALVAAMAGDGKPLPTRARSSTSDSQKMESWLDEVKTSKETKPAKEAKAGQAGQAGQEAQAGQAVVFTP